MPALPTGMVRHRNGQYYLRRRIPLDLIASYDGKQEIQRSLKSANYHKAHERFRLQDSHLVQEWEQKRQRLAEFVAARHLDTALLLTKLTDEDIERICAHFEAASLAGDEKRREEGNYDSAEIAEYQENYSEGILVLKAAVAIGDVKILGPFLRQFLDLYRYRINVPEDEFRRLAIAMGRAAIRTNEKLLKRYQGEDIPTPHVAVREQHLLSVVIKDYLASYPAAKHAAMYKKIVGVLPMFLEAVGDKPIHLLRQTDINRFFDLVHQLPPRWKDVARQRSLTVRQVAELNLGEMSPGTFDGTYKAVITPFLKWCYTNWQDRGFPTTLTTEMITYQGSREDGESHQRAFTLTELQRLFGSQEMAAIATDPTRQHEYWLPVLGLYTGARVNELCQLNPQVDIRYDTDTALWFLDITDETEAHEDVDKLVKTTTSKRKIPLHPQLVALGFVQYIKWRQARGDKLLFPEFPPSQGRASADAQKWFRQFLKERGLRDETPGAKLTGMHAFRSTFLSCAFNRNVVNAEAITGHAQSVTAISTVQDNMVSGQVSPVVMLYRGELDLANKQKILERIGWDGLIHIAPISQTWSEEASNADTPASGMMQGEPT